MKNEVVSQDSKKQPESATVADQPKAEEVNSSPKPNYWLIGGFLALLVIIIAVFFFVHIRAQRLNGFTRNYFIGRNYNFGGRPFHHIMMSNNEISGKVNAVNGSNFTVDASGTSKTVVITPATRFPTTSATKVNVGDQVIVFGLQDSTGVIQADEIVVNPANNSTTY